MQHAHMHRPAHGKSRIEIQDLSLMIDGKQILDGISLSLDEPRIGVIGRNGSGKTSLARVLCGLVSPENGSVEICGVDVFNDRKGALSEIGIIFQNPDHQIIFPTVEEEVAFGVRQQGESKEDALRLAHETLLRFGVLDWAERSVAELSQGQKHLVCLISVLAMQPSVIVLDEPFTGLDYLTSQALRRYLSGLDEMLVHITHDIAALEAFDRVIWIDNGSIKDDGRPDDILTRYISEMQKLEDDEHAITHISS